MKLRGSIGKLLLGVLGCLLAALAVAGIRKARVGEATVHAMHKGPAKGTLPHYLKEELEERREAHEREIKLLSRNRQRSTPSLASHEGPRSLAEEKLASRAFPGEGLRSLGKENPPSRPSRGGALPLEGAAIGRREMSRLAGFIDEHSNSGRPWEDLGPDNAVFPVVTSRTNKAYVTSGRITALAIDPRCAVSKGDEQRDDADRHCRLFVAAAGGGVW